MIHQRGRGPGQQRSELSTIWIKYQ